MKKLVQIAILFLFLQPQVSNSIVWLNYITNTFCVNQDKPELKCNGKCHLIKQLNTNETQEREVPEPINVNVELVLFFNQPNLERTTENSNKEIAACPAGIYLFNPSLKIDKPPIS
jgi:hypothetical protein